MLETYKDVKDPEQKGREHFREGLRAMGNESGIPRAKDLFTLAVEEGCTEAMVNLGAIYSQGDQTDKETALSLFMRAAAAEDAVGMRNVGYFHALGIGVPRDKKLAAEWYEKAALKGNARAQCNLGVLYAFGNGVPQNYEKAAYWYKRSAENGYSRGQTNLGVLLIQGKGVEMNHLQGEGVPYDADEGWRLMRSSAAGGYSKALVAVAHTIEGTDPERSVDMYRAAAGKGSEEAKKRLAELGIAVPTAKGKQ
jgi:TPR repeat protein